MFRAMTTDKSYTPPLLDTARENLLRVAEAFCRYSGTSRNAMSGVILNDTKFLQRVSDGANFTLAQYDRTMGAFSRLWPDDLPWPDQTPRPAPSRLDPMVVSVAQRKVEAGRARIDRRQKQEATANGRAA